MLEILMDIVITLMNEFKGKRCFYINSEVYCLLYSTHWRRITMAITNVLLISQICGYVISVILSLSVVIPMTLHQEEFRGHCLLFSTGSWQESGQFLVNWASQAYCNYTIFVGVLLFVVSAIQIYRLSVFAYTETDSSFLSAFIDVITCIVLCIFTLLASCMITFGFMTWCKNMTERFPSCEVAAGNEIDKQDRINTNGFYIELGTAQFGIWLSWACWVGLTVFALLKLCRYHQLENMRVSMFRERQRLINEGMCAVVESTQPKPKDGPSSSTEPGPP